MIRHSFGRCCMPGHFLPAGIRYRSHAEYRDDLKLRRASALSKRLPMMMMTRAFVELSRMMGFDFSVDTGAHDFRSTARSASAAAREHYDCTQKASSRRNFVIRFYRDEPASPVFSSPRLGSPVQRSKKGGIAL